MLGHTWVDNLMNTSMSKQLYYLNPQWAINLLSSSCQILELWQIYDFHDGKITIESILIPPCHSQHTRILPCS